MYTRRSKYYDRHQDHAEIKLRYPYLYKEPKTMMLAAVSVYTLVFVDLQQGQCRYDL